MLIKSRVDKKKRKILLRSLQGHHFLSYLLQKAQRLASSFPNPKYLCHFLSGLINYFKTCVEIEIPSVISSLLCMNDNFLDRKSTRLNSSHLRRSRMPSSA